MLWNKRFINIRFIEWIEKHPAAVFCSPVVLLLWRLTHRAEAFRFTVTHFP